MNGCHGLRSEVWVVQPNDTGNELEVVSVFWVVLGVLWWANKDGLFLGVDKEMLVSGEFVCSLGQVDDSHQGVVGGVFVA